MCAFVETLILYMKCYFQLHNATAHVLGNFSRNTPLTDTTAIYHQRIHRTHPIHCFFLSFAPINTLHKKITTAPHEIAYKFSKRLTQLEKNIIILFWLKTSSIILQSSTENYHKLVKILHSFVY